MANSVIGMEMATKNMCDANQHDTVVSMRPHLIRIWRQTMTLIDSTDEEDEQKIRWKAVCINCTGIIHRRTHNYTAAIRCYDEGIQLLTALNSPMKYVVYANIKLNKCNSLGSRDVDGAIACYEEAKLAFSKAEDISEDERKSWMERCSRIIARLRE